MAQYDVYDIESRIREFDPELFRRIDFDTHRGVHQIICFDPVEGEEYIGFTVPHGKLDHRTFVRYMEIHPKSGFNALKEVDKALAEKARREDKKIGEMARDFADMLHKPLIENYYYGG